MRTDTIGFEYGSHARRRHHVRRAEFGERLVGVAQEAGPVGAEKRRATGKGAKDLHHGLYVLHQYC